MCLAIPGVVARVTEGGSPLARTALVDFAGVRKTVSLAFVPEAGCGDYVLVHAGMAIATVDPAEAARTLDALAELERAA